MMDKNVIFMSAGEINDELAEIKHEYPDVVFLSTNGKAADIPDDLVRIPKGTWLWNLKADLLVSKKSLDAYTAMAVQAAKEGVVMRVTSAYRSYNDQIEALSIQARRYGEKRAS